MNALLLADALESIVKFKAAHDGNSPSVREIADDLGISSTSVVQRCLRKLQDDGLIEYRGSGMSRMICVVGGNWTGPAIYEEEREKR